MSQDLDEYAQIFRDCVDELNVLQKRADERAEARADNLAKVAKDCLHANSEQMHKFGLQIDGASRSIDRINHSAEKVDGHISFCTKHVKLALGFFFGSLFLAACIWVGTYFWYKHVAGEVAEARLELAQANVKLQNKPLFLPASSSVSGAQSDYVRVVPSTETTLRHANGEPYPGVYAEVWTKNSGTDRDWLNE